MIWYFEFFLRKVWNVSYNGTNQENVGHSIIFQFITFILGWIISINIKSELRYSNSSLTLNEKQNIYVPTFELWEHIIGCYAQSMTIKLTWMINYHLRSSPSCFVSFWGKNKAMCYNNFIHVSVKNSYQIDLLSICFISLSRHGYEIRPFLV